MKSTTTIAFALLFAASPLAALAEAPPAPAPQAGAEQPAPASTSGLVSCQLGEISSVPADRARVWRSLLCDELAKRGMRVTMGAGDEVYRLDLLKLEKQLVARLTREKPAGTWAGSERTTLSDEDELLKALPRLVAALSDGHSFEHTAAVTNLTTAETVKPLKRTGEMFAGGSVLGVGFIGIEKARIAPGLGLTVAYETPQIAAVGDLRFTINGDGKEQFKGSLVAVSIGGRYFFTQSDITPFVGLGTSASWVSYSVPVADTSAQGQGFTRTDERKGSGFGLYLELGVEALRTHKGRLVFSGRVDLPTYTAKGVTEYVYPAVSYPTSTYERATPRQVTPESRYVVPVGLSATYYFY